MLQARTSLLKLVEGIFEVFHHWRSFFLIFLGFVILLSRCTLISELIISIRRLLGFLPCGFLSQISVSIVYVLGYSFSDPIYFDAIEIIQLSSNITSSSYVLEPELIFHLYFLFKIYSSFSFLLRTLIRKVTKFLTIVTSHF